MVRRYKRRRNNYARHKMHPYGLIINTFYFQGKVDYHNRYNGHKCLNWWEYEMSLIDNRSVRRKYRQELRNRFFS